MWRQALEMVAVALVTGNGPGFYHTAGLYRRSIPWREKWQHLNQSEYEYRLRKLNPVHYQKISQYKLSEKGLLQLLGFPTPRFLDIAISPNGPVIVEKNVQPGREGASRVDIPSGRFLPP